MDLLFKRSCARSNAAFDATSLASADWICATAVTNLLWSVVRLVEIDHSPVCADLLLVPDRHRCDHLDPASLARLLIENDSRVAAIIQFDA